MNLTEPLTSPVETTPTPPKRLVRWFSSGWAVLVFFALTTVAFTWPLVTGLTNTLPDWGDPPDVAWRMGSIAHQLWNDPLHLYQTDAFYPNNNGIALNELLTGEGILASPIYWLTGNPALAYNLLNFLSFTLSGWAMWLLVRYLTGSSAAGLVAGMIYTFSPWHYGQYGHLPLAAQQWMILALYFLIRFLERSKPPVINTVKDRNWINLSLFILFFVLQALVAGYFAYFEAILIFVFVVYYFLFESGLARQLWQRLRKRPIVTQLTTSWQQFGAIIGAGSLGGLLILPFIAPFVAAQRTYGFKRSLTEVNYWSAAPTSFLRTTQQSWLYNPIERGVFGLETSAERALYPGIVALVLAIIGLTASKRYFEKSSASRRWLFLTVSLTGLVLSFGPTLNLEAYGLNSTGIPMPYRWLYGLVPGFDALRVAYRFGQLFMLGLSVLAGYGTLRLLKLGWLRQSVRGYRVGHIVLASTLVILVGVDFFAPGVSMTPTPTGDTAPAMYRWLAGPEADKIVDKDALLLELPISDNPTPITSGPIYLLYSLSHGRPMLNGSANIIPPGYDRLFYEMQSFPSPATLDIAEALKVQFLLVHTKGLASDSNRAELARQCAPDGRLELIKTFPALDGDPNYNDAIYRIKPNPQRFQQLSDLIPPGAEVLLAGDAHQHRLYTGILPGLIGSDRHYFSSFNTIYHPEVDQADPSRIYDYAIFYTGTDPARYGYTPADRLPEDNDVIDIYHKASR